MVCVNKKELRNRILFNLTIFHRSRKIFQKILDVVIFGVDNAEYCGILPPDLERIPKEREVRQTF